MFLLSSVQNKKKYGLNYSMMKVKKKELDKVTFPHSSKLMNIKGMEMVDRDVNIELGDNLTLMSQIPYISVTYGNCMGNPCKCLCSTCLYVIM